MPIPIPNHISELAEIPTVEEFAKLDKKKRKKLITQIRKELSLQHDFQAGNRDPWLEGSGLAHATKLQTTISGLEAQLVAYKTIKTPEERAKEAENKEIETTGDPSKFDAWQWAGAAAGGVAMYENVVALANDYIEDQMDEALKPKKCSNLDPPIEYAKKCKTNDDCGPSQKCFKKHDVIGVDLFAQAGVDLMDFPDDIEEDEGRCGNACVRSVTQQYWTDEKSLTELLDDIIVDAQPLSACISPYFVKFFNVVPWKFFLMKKLEGHINDLLSIAGVDMDQINQQLKENTICEVPTGNIQDIRDAARIPSLFDGWPFPLPPLPMLKIDLGYLKILIDPLSIVRKIIIDLLCYELCKLLTPLMLVAINAMLEIEQNLIESYNKDTGQTVPGYGDFELEKIDINRFILDKVLKDAADLDYVYLGEKITRGQTSYDLGHEHEFEVDENGDGIAVLKCHPNTDKICHSHKVMNGVVQRGQSGCYPHCKQMYGFAGSAPHDHSLTGFGVSLVRDYISYVNEKLKFANPADPKVVGEGATLPAPARILTVQEIITLLTGNASCALRAALIKAGHPPNSTLFDPAVGDKYKSLDLSTEERILRFWKYLGDHMSVFAFIEESKAACYPNICPADDVLLNQLVSQMNTICELLKTPEKLLPLDAAGLEKIALEMANKVLNEHPSTKDSGSKMDKGDPDAILGKDVLKMRALTERCRQTKRVYTALSILPPTKLPGMEIGGEYPYYNNFDGDPDDYGDDVGTGPFKTSAFVSPPCAGELSPRARAAPRKLGGVGADKSPGAENPCCKHAGLKPNNNDGFADADEHPAFGSEYPWHKGAVDIKRSAEPGKSLTTIHNLLNFAGGIAGLDGDPAAASSHTQNMIDHVKKLPDETKCWVCRGIKGTYTYQKPQTFWWMMRVFIYDAIKAGGSGGGVSWSHIATGYRKQLAVALNCEKFGFPLAEDAQGKKLDYSNGRDDKIDNVEGSPAWRMYKGQCPKE